MIEDLMKNLMNLNPAELLNLYESFAKLNVMNKIYVLLKVQENFVLQ